MTTGADRVTLGVGLAGVAGSLVIHLAGLLGGDLTPSPPWPWLLHGGTIVGFWRVAARVAPARLSGLDGFLRVRRMIPIPLRIALAGAALNTLVAGSLALAGRGDAGRVLSAYWLLMYLLVTVAFACVVPRLSAADPVGAAPGARS